MEIFNITNFNEFITRAQSTYENGPESLIIGISPTQSIWTNRSNNLNETNLEKAVVDYHGGAIVNFPGDLNLLLTTYGDSDFGLQCLQKVNEYLQSQNITSSISGNDLMIGDRKVASFTKRAHLNGWYQNIIHFSINTDIELVQSICTKMTSKIPGRLLDYNIGSKRLLKVLDDLIKSL